MKIIFMGTPDFAEALLDTLIHSEHEVVCVVTQPDKPRGRKGILTSPPVKALAEANNIPVLQPLKVREEGFAEKLAAYKADVFVVAAFGQIIPPDILHMPKYGCVNIHGSLLPDYRGAAPIQWAVIDGEKETGITSMQMDEGLDTGDILIKRSIEIAPKETAGTLFERLKPLGSEVLLETLSGLEAGMITPVKQGTPRRGYAKILKKSMGLIDFSKSAREIECFIRGMDPWPSAYTKLDGKMLKIWSADVSTLDSGRPAGTVTEIDSKSFSIACGSGTLIAKEVQPEGKKRISVSDYLNGHALTVGTVFGNS